MHRRLAKLFLLVAALALLAFGAATLAFGGSKTSPLKSNLAAHVKAAADGDNIQQGDQTAPDTTSAEAPAETAATAGETPGAESAATDADQAAQDAACAAAGIDSGGANVQYDGTTCSKNG